MRRYFASHGASIIVARQPTTLSMQDELVEDLITIVTSFSGRVHGMRGTHGKHARTRADPSDKVADKAVSDAIDAAIDVAVRAIMNRSEISRSGMV